MREYIGIDIGGTKCAVVRGDENGRILKKLRFLTTDRERTLEEIIRAAEELLTPDVRAIGISCGGPLNSGTGEILGPPNLPGWDHVPIKKLLEERFGLPVHLKNDADACAVAEWKFGAGRGTENMIFLTFGTGLGAGLILNGKLYEGSTGMAGETGHIRLFADGHTGYGKAGSYEGYCSGGGIAQYGLGTAEELYQKAMEGDPEAVGIWEQTGRNLGRLLAILMDLLNPEAIVIGSIFVRAGHLMEAEMNRILEKEVLLPNRQACRVLPAGLGETLGDVAALSVAMEDFA
ncbi:MAG: ROK family protein [Lachnospiraceae bacterium]|nr:ROK family protein [Lachnospiraceae bacterium]